MNKQDWPVFLTALNKQILSDEIFQEAGYEITNAQRAAGWLGNPGATEAELEGLERRLGCQLPPSYRSFLAASNGFGPISYFIYDLCAVADINWLVEEESELVEIWEAAPTPPDHPKLADEQYLRYDDQQSAGILKPNHLRQCLLISHWGDAGFLALNPAQQHAGEWEAWHFANWMPGAHRYRSFADLMQQSYQGYLALRQESE